jgi:hypothetical protein
MPNGGEDNCANCVHYDEAESFCSLRRTIIESSHWTTCRNFDPSWRSAKQGFRSNENIDGPIYAIVCEVKGHAGRYARLPYFEGCRVDTCEKKSLQPGDCKGDTIVYFVDADGNRYEFNSVDDYMNFWRANSMYAKSIAREL